MGNPLPPTTHIGTIGELFAQLRLLEYGIQAASPIIDSGNDLIAIKDEVVKFIQIKTSENGIFNTSDLPEVYHLVVLVELKKSRNGSLLLDASTLYFFKKGENISQKKELTKELANQIWNSTNT